MLNPANANRPPLGVMALSITQTTMNLNWRQILARLISFWLFIYGFKTLSYLYSPKMLDYLRMTTEKGESLKFYKQYLNDFNFGIYARIITLSGYIGLVAAYLWSLKISKDRLWSRLNDTLAFIAILLLFRFDLLGWSVLREIFLFPGRMVANTIAELIINGLIMVTLGIITLYSPFVNRFIERKSQTDS